MFTSFFLKANNIDSLQQELNHTTDNNKKIIVLNALYNKTKYSDLEKAIEYAKQSIELSKLIKDTFNLGIAYKSLGNSYSYKGYNELAMQNYQNSLTEFKKLNNEIEIAKTINNIANVYLKTGDDKQALDNYNKSLNTILKYKKEEYYGMFYLNVIALYSRQGRVDTVLYLLQKAKKISNFNNNFNITIPAKYNSILAGCFYQKNMIDSSLYYYNRSIKLAEESKIDYFLEMAYNNIAAIYLELKNYKLASKYYLSCLNLSLKSGNLSNQYKAYKGLNKLNIELGNYKIASNYMNEYVSVKDSLYEKGTSARIEELRLLYDIETKNKEIALIEKNSKIAILKSENSNAKSKQILYLIIIVILIIVSLSVIFIIQTRRKLLNTELEKNKLKNTYLKKEIQFKNTQLTDFALYIIKRNDFLRKITAQLKKLKKIVNKDILPEVTNIEEIIKYSINISKDRKEFNSQVELVNQEFNERIEEKYPELTKNERNIAILLKLNLSSKEIASILNVTSKSIDNYRYNIRKKLSLSPKDDLNTILKNI